MHSGLDEFALDYFMRRFTKLCVSGSQWLSKMFRLTSLRDYTILFYLNLNFIKYLTTKEILIT
jgi:hypothetical protein